MELVYLTDGRFYRCELCAQKFDLLELVSDPQALQTHIQLNHPDVTAVTIKDVGIGNLLSDGDTPRELTSIDEEYARNFINGMTVIANNKSGGAHISMLRSDLAKLITCYEYLLTKDSDG